MGAGEFFYHYPVRLRFATARHPFASEGDFCAMPSEGGIYSLTNNNSRL
ncbi:MAG: hypothetical protein LBB23_02550 [Rickettsiales bacterium]|nr:hypothetical protein [Rickettsiales bacterium]